MKEYTAAVQSRSSNLWKLSDYFKSKEKNVIILIFLFKSDRLKQVCSFWF